ncbi:Alpha/Beta hydrolase protein [Schizophyllum fasciatum]
MFAFLWRHQPFRAIYILWKLYTTGIFWIPLWVTVAVIPFFRPRRSWSVVKTIKVQLIRRLGDVSAVTGPLFSEPDHTDIVPTADGAGVWVNPAPDLIIGPVKLWASITGVLPARIPGYWMHPRGSTKAVGAPPVAGEKVLYSLHGGGFTEGSAHPDHIISNAARRIVDSSKTVRRVFAIEYRLSSASHGKRANPFPAALVDALAGYKYLVEDVGFAPKDIIVEGDSAGGGLALTLVRYLVEHIDSGLLPPPGALLLLSPWVDLGCSHDVPSPPPRRLFVADFDPEPTGWDDAKDAYIGPALGQGFADMSPYVSPASKHPAADVSFARFPRTFIAAGGAENLLPQIRLLRDRMVRDLGPAEGGGKVAYFEADDEAHDYLIFGFQPGTRNALARLSTWLDS